MSVAYVTVGVRMDSEFIRLLQAEVALSNLGNRDQLTPSQQLAMAVLMEGRGAYEEQVHAAILPVWRPHIEILSELRKVEES